MCYDKEYYERKLAKLASRYGTDDDDFEPKTRYKESGFDHLESPILTSENPTKFQLYRWGLIPNWQQNPDKIYSHWNYTLNAVSEAVFTTASFRGIIMTKRCLIPVTAFFEHMDVKGKKIPHRIFVKSNEVFSLAGIYDECKHPETGEILKTYAILTCPANELMAKIHNLKRRMPVIIPKEREKEWLKMDLTKEEIESFFIPYPTEDMNSHPIDKKQFNDKNNSGPFERKEYPELDNEQGELF